MGDRVIVGYGTLLLRESLGKTVGEAAVEAARLIPAVGRGYRRLYDFAPAHYKPAFKLSALPVELAAANIEPADGFEFNCLAFEATESEIAALDLREKDYERVPVDLFAFGSCEALGQGFAYLCPGGHPRICRDHRKLLPHWRDVLYARTGSYRVSPDFGKMYDATSFAADGVTRLDEVFGGRYAELVDLDTWP